MIPDEKKPIPWGLPPLRSEVIQRQQQQQQQQQKQSTEAHEIPASSSSAIQEKPCLEKRSHAVSIEYPADDHYTYHAPGYVPLQQSSVHSNADLPSPVKRMCILALGTISMVAALLYIRLVMYDPNIIDPGLFSATTLGTSVDTLEAVDLLLKAAADTQNTVAWDRLAEMTDLFGHRMTASSGYDLSAEWVVNTTNALDTGLKAYTEPVWVDEWYRGSEKLQLLVPTRPGGVVDVPMLGLGRSPGTPPEGLEAQVIPVHSFEELQRLGKKTVFGNIVLYNFSYKGYGSTVRFRSRGAREAEKYGAIAVLVRTIAPDSSFHTVHTGTMAAASIPAAAISLADANMIERMYDRSVRDSAKYVAPRVRLTMGAKLRENATQSANVIIDLKGSESPNEVVLLSGHFDSWDVGVGAMDDGAGAFVAWEAARLISQIASRPPRRTIRVVMWNNEETQQRGAKAYYQHHRSEIAQHRFAIESDIGVFEPWGLSVRADAKLTRILEDYGKDLLKVLGAGNLTSSEVESPGQDIAVLCENGVPCAGLLSTNPENNAVPGDALWDEHYFRYHHAPSDRVEIIDRHQLRRSAAALAAWAYLIADLR
ncbi:hypothetical protein GGI07_000139 [Coemansia sp. Benny D115]|nr:hypothetical protein GGI07_000139 [Coemansia sp. Benny D115]